MNVPVAYDVRLINELVEYQIVLKEESVQTARHDLDWFTIQFKIPVLGVPKVMLFKVVTIQYVILEDIVSKDKLGALGKSDTAEMILEKDVMIDPVSKVIICLCSIQL